MLRQHVTCLAENQNMKVAFDRLGIQGNLLRISTKKHNKAGGGSAHACIAIAI